MMDEMQAGYDRDHAVKRKVDDVVRAIDAALTDAETAQRLREAGRSDLEGARKSAKRVSDHIVAVWN